MPHIEHGLAAEALFDKQVDTYLQLGFIALIGSQHFDELKAQLLAVVDEPSVPNLVPNFFSLTIPDAAIPINEQLRLAGCRAFLRGEDMVNIENWEQEPALPYALLDVDDGEGYRGVPAETAAAVITANHRHSLRINELVSLAILAPQLWSPPRRGLYAAATLHLEEGLSPATVDLYRYGDGGLKVKRDPGTISDADWTTPSYFDRVIVG